MPEEEDKPIRGEVPTWREMAYLALIKALDEGQLVILASFFLLISLIWNLPEDFNAEMIMTVLNYLRDGSLLGWLLLLLVIVIWQFNVNWVDVNTKSENKRVGKKKTELQKENVSLSQRVAELEERLKKGGGRPDNKKK